VAGQSAVPSTTGCRSDVTVPPVCPFVPLSAGTSASPLASRRAASTAVFPGGDVGGDAT
jgi:hypothetical protein